MGNLRVDAPAVEKVEVPVELVREARAVPTLKGRVHLCSTRREGLVVEGVVVGFVTPHETKMGWRHGPIFVRPGFRRRGLVKAYYDAHPERLCVAFVPDGNNASRAMHKAAGFTDLRRGAGGWFMRREPRAGAADATRQ